jgi:alkyl hydroperoxide reductase subunit AhpC
VQLGKLQERLGDFDKRGVSIVVVSVDPPQATIPWAQDKGFTFPMASDPQKRVIEALDLVNPEAPDLALHAVFILDTDGTIFYRKIARRRAYPPEFRDAIDYHLRRGKYAEGT